MRYTWISVRGACAVNAWNADGHISGDRFGGKVSVSELRLVRSRETSANSDNSLIQMNKHKDKRQIEKRKAYKGRRKALEA
jgi:hypothetical protein